MAEKSFSRGSDPRKPGWAAVAVVIPDVDDIVQLIVVAGCLAAGDVVVGTENELKNDFEGLGLLIEKGLPDRQGLLRGIEVVNSFRTCVSMM